ncbi:MAG TPA: type II CAAX endopeptidase family protein [Roseiflexaceae bacterium]|nr:type II CAAX endopeptidase family protein [Roseiflexaceae bacterium]
MSQIDTVADFGRAPESSPPAPAAPRGWRGLDVLLIGLLCLALTVAGAMVVTVAVMLLGGVPLSGDAQEMTEALTRSLPFSAGVLLAQTLAFAGSVAAGMFWRGLRPADLGLGRPELRWLLIGLGTAVALRLLVVPLALVLQLLGAPTDNPQVNLLAPEGGFAWLPALTMILVAGVVVPIGEELLFRGVVYNWLRGRGFWLAAILSSALFGLVHGHVTIGIMAFVLGLVCAFVYERSRSLWTPIAVHIGFNVLGIAVLYLMLAAGVQMPG